MLEKINMQRFLSELIARNVRKENKAMEQKKEQKKSYVCYVYGQIYAGFLKGNKNEYVLVKNTKAQSWDRILNWFKENNCIEDFKLGNTPETAGEVVVKGFNENKMLYKKYCQAIEENLEKEMQIA